MDQLQARIEAQPGGHDLEAQISAQGVRDVAAEYRGEPKRRVRHIRVGPLHLGDPPFHLGEVA